MLARMWRKVNPYSLLGMYICTGITENRREFPQKIKNRTTLWSCSSPFDQFFLKIQCGFQSFSASHFFQCSHFFIALRPSTLCEKATKTDIKYYVKFQLSEVTTNNILIYSLSAFFLLIYILMYVFIFFSYKFFTEIIYTP